MPEVVIAAIAATGGAEYGRMTIALLCGAGGGLLLMRSRPRLQGTTLLAPWGWCCAALAAVVCAELLAGSGWTASTSPQAEAHLRYGAAITTLAPIVALLGAKRPQDRAWQWIVLSLLALLALPILKAIAFGRGASPELHTAWRWLIALIALAGLFNYLPTRQAPAAALYFCGQALLLAEYLPGADWPSSSQRWLAGLACLVAALFAASISAARERGATETPENQLWLDFRDAFGALWALRVAERFNASAGQQEWNVWLSWSGLRQVHGPENDPQQPQAMAVISAEIRPALHQTLKSLLWRFVSPQWVAQRIGEDERPT
ncbi:MAG TPA: hypothetical protein VHC19_25655 [Pirellulales bacterium]|nr:hypothetical protein [Pirellulales bacterium]